MGQFNIIGNYNFGHTFYVQPYKFGHHGTFFFLIFCFPLFYNFGHTFDVQPYKFGHHETFLFLFFNLLFSTFRIIFTSRALLNYSLTFFFFFFLFFFFFFF